MRDIPMFSTEYGVASLILREIVYKKEAYIRIQSSETPIELVKEAWDFCKAAGAKRVYATGHPLLENYPLHTVLVRMICKRSLLPRPNATTVKVTEQTIDQWRAAYNDRMSDVPNTATMTIADGKKIVDDGSAYFVYKDDVCIGFGKITGTIIEAIGSLVPGAGECVLLALVSLIVGDTVQVEVALNNDRAVRLYKRLGFEVDEVISNWYRVQ